MSRVQVQVPSEILVCEYRNSLCLSMYLRSCLILQIVDPSDTRREDCTSHQFHTHPMYCNGHAATTIHSQGRFTDT